MYGEQRKFTVNLQCCSLHNFVYSKLQQHFNMVAEEFNTGNIISVILDLILWESTFNLLV